MSKSIIGIGLASILAATTASAAPTTVTGVPIGTHSGGGGCTSWQFKDQDDTRYMVWTGDRYPTLHGAVQVNIIAKVPEAVKVLLSAALGQQITITYDPDVVGPPGGTGICHGSPAFFASDVDGP